MQLTTTPGVGPIVAASFVSVVDDAYRFRRAHQVESYLGLVPSEDTTGGKRRLGAISKQGNSYLRALLVQAAWVIMRQPGRQNPYSVGRLRSPLDAASASPPLRWLAALPACCGRCGVTGPYTIPNAPPTPPPVGCASKRRASNSRRKRSSARQGSLANTCLHG
jgi:hypothetical protein